MRQLYRVWFSTMSAVLVSTALLGCSSGSNSGGSSAAGDTSKSRGATSSTGATTPMAPTGKTGPTGPTGKTGRTDTTTTPPAAQGDWGTLSGQIVWGGKELPPVTFINVDKDQAHCLGQGQIPREDYVVNPKNKGVRWAMVWIAVDNEGKADVKGKMPTHPRFERVSPAKVVLDQPYCRFEPHVLGIREGQILEIKNSSPIPHNTNLIGGALNPTLNVLLAPRTSKEITGWKAAVPPVPINCNIHGWMRGYIRVFNHPYFAVSDADGNFKIENAPVGKFRLLVWHPEAGWVGSDKNGKELQIKPGTNDLGKIALTP